MMTSTTSRTAQFGISKWKDLCRDLNEQPRDDGVRDGDLVNIAPFQFAEEILRIHCSFLCHTAPHRSSRSTVIRDRNQYSALERGPDRENSAVSDRGQ